MIAICKDKLAWYPRFFSKCSDTVNHRLWGREFNKCTLFDDQVGQKIKKVIVALKITSGAQTDSCKSMGAHGVGRFVVFMCLTVSTKGCMAMIFVGEAMAQDNFMRAIVG